VQGGLLASVIAAREEEKRTPKYLITIAFLLAKLVAYTLLGLLLGLLGEKLSLSTTTQSILQLAAGLYMLAIAFNLLNVHPIFRYAVIQPPRFLTKLVKKESRNSDLFAPILLGFLTIFIPCGTTLGMEALAISTSSPISGALTMFFFVLGTIPACLGFGLATTFLGNTFRKRFSLISALVLIYLGVTSINGTLVLLGSPVSLAKITAPLTELGSILVNPAGDVSENTNTGVTAANGVQNATINVSGRGYSPRNLQVKAGSPVKLTLNPQGSLGCLSVFVIPELNISKRVETHGLTIVEFTPEKPGELTYTCSMGMFTGKIQVI
ncbi:MAG: sulfite exporter TauE/SafE family protein, partial [bacterium]|nr:sulfite exporter TauE/SafE family protein [bacterium]